jgi:hypothetical protein
MSHSLKKSFPNIFRKVTDIETGTSVGTNIAFTSSTPMSMSMPMPIQPSGNGNGNGSASLNMSQNIHKGGMVRPL